MIKTVIFDADGVLINGAKFAAVRARELKIDKAKEEEFFTTIFQECLIGRADLKEVLMPYMKAFGWKNGVEAFLEYWFTSEHSVDKRMIDAVHMLKTSGIRVVLATNQEHYRTAYMTKEMGFGMLFEKIYASAQVGFKKPDYDFYAHVLRDMAEDKDSVLFWDDDPKNIAGAREYVSPPSYMKDTRSFWGE